MIYSQKHNAKMQRSEGICVWDRRTFSYIKHQFQCECGTYGHILKRGGSKGTDTQPLNSVSIKPILVQQYQPAQADNQQSMGMGQSR